MNYSVCFLFSPDGNKVLLELKTKTDFKGCLNGVGGKQERGETVEQCALREIEEETGISSVSSFIWIGSLNLPWDCSTPGSHTCCLHFYAGIVPDMVVPKMEIADEKLIWFSTHDVLSAPFADSQFAGHGDVQYFVKAGYDTLFKGGPTAG